MRGMAAAIPAVAMFAGSVIGVTGCDAETRLDAIRLPPGFRIAVYAAAHGVALSMCK